MGGGASLAFAVSIAFVACFPGRTLSICIDTERILDFRCTVALRYTLDKLPDHEGDNWIRTSVEDAAGQVASPMDIEYSVSNRRPGANLDAACRQHDTYACFKLLSVRRYGAELGGCPQYIHCTYSQNLRVVPSALPVVLGGCFCVPGVASMIS